MNKIIALIVGLLVSQIVWAGSATVSWTPPTENTDGSPILETGPTALTNYRIVWGACDGGQYAGDGTKIGEAIVPHPQTSYTINDLAPGTYCFIAFASNMYAESAPSNSASKVIEVPVPRPPVLTVESVVYELKLNPDTMVASLGRKVGAIAYGVTCTGEPVVTNKRGEYFEVPKDNVYFSKDPRSPIVVARCAAT